MAYAPRFHAYWSRLEGHSILTMARSDWDQLGVRPGQPTLLDIEKMPMAKTASDATVIATVARQYSSASGEVRICRSDPSDAPTPVNVDRYDFWVDLPSHRSFTQMVACSRRRRPDRPPHIEECRARLVRGSDVILPGCVPLVTTLGAGDAHATGRRTP
jgi:hypothetical protein